MVSGVYLFALIRKLWRGSGPASPPIKEQPTKPVVVPIISAEMQTAYGNARGRVDLIGVQSTPPPDSPAANTPLSPSGMRTEQKQEPETPASVRPPVRTSDWVEKAPETLQPAIARPAVIFTDYSTKLTGYTSPRVKHPVAVYRDETGQLIAVSYRDLQSNQNFLEARRHDLFTPDESKRLQVRHGPGIRHFWCPSDDELSLTFSKASIGGKEDQRETDPSHEKRIQYIVAAANRVQPAWLMTIDYEAKGNGIKPDISARVDSDQFILADINGYS